MGVELLGRGAGDGEALEHHRHEVEFRLAAVEEGEAPDGIEIAKIDVEFALDGKGELVWDLSAGHFRTFELSGRTSIKTSVHTKVEVNGKVRDVKQTSELAGTSGFSAKTK